MWELQVLALHGFRLLMNRYGSENTQFDTHFYANTSGSVIENRIVQMFMKLKTSEIWGEGNKICPLYWCTVWDVKIKVYVWRKCLCNQRWIHGRDNCVWWKVKLSLYLIKRHAMKTYWATFLTSALDKGKWSASRPCRLFPEERSLRYSLDSGLGGTQSRSRSVEKRDIFPFAWIQTPAFQTITRCYTNWADLLNISTETHSVIILHIQMRFGRVFLLIILCKFGRTCIRAPPIECHILTDSDTRTRPYFVSGRDELKYSITRVVQGRELPSSCRYF
jgi:hypothetical protein